MLMDPLSFPLSDEAIYLSHERIRDGDITSDAILSAMWRVGLSESYNFDDLRASLKEGLPKYIERLEAMAAKEPYDGIGKEIEEAKETLEGLEARKDDVVKFMGFTIHTRRWDENDQDSGNKKPDSGYESIGYLSDEIDKTFPDEKFPLD